MTVDAWLAAEEDRACLLVKMFVVPVTLLDGMTQQVERVLDLVEQYEAVARALRVKVERRCRYPHSVEQVVQAFGECRVREFKSQERHYFTACWFPGYRRTGRSIQTPNCSGPCIVVRIELAGPDDIEAVHGTARRQNTA